VIKIYVSSVFMLFLPIINHFDRKVSQKIVCLVTKETTVKSMPKMKYEMCTENN